MSTAELVFRLVALVVGAGLAVTGALLGYRDREQGCLPFIVALVGLFMIGTAFPGEQIFR